MLKSVFIILSLIAAIADLIVAIAAFDKGKMKGKFLGGTFIFAAVVDVTYVLSVISEDYFKMSLASSIYFVSVDFMLLFLVSFVYELVEPKRTKIGTVMFVATMIVALADITMLMINPFKEFVIHYNESGNPNVPWVYEPYGLYNAHLGFSYLMIVAIFVHLIAKVASTPRVYRAKYLTVLYGILFVVVLNAIFLFLPFVDMLDFSILFYSVIGYYMYWSAYHYSEHGMLNKIRHVILDELGHPVVLFDNENKFASCNSDSKRWISAKQQKEGFTLAEFVEQMRFDKNLVDAKEDTHFLWHYNKDSEMQAYRCDYRVLKDENNEIVGRMFVFTDNSLEVDILTGFHSKNSYETYFSNHNPEPNYPVGITICDINKLSEINSSQGETMGDRAIQYLANAMRNAMPDSTFFARLNDANLLAICPKSDTKMMREYIAQIRNELHEYDEFVIPLEFQSAISIADADNPSIMDAVKVAKSSMRGRKLMDANSAHSSLLDSLAQTLMESDSGTQAHVERTKIMGELLGQRMGLSDIQLSNLAILCLLHDIGKLGIPLEILNKPSKLNDAEWDVMRSHVDKGYRIAKASAELEPIADLILHHHECWDGHGYPDGLSQENIPLLSRIIAVVDTYDAMTYDRPYRVAMSKQAARAELRRCAGTQFDPYVVSEFLALLDEIDPVSPDELQDTKEVIDSFTPMGLMTEEEIRGTAKNTHVMQYSKYILDQNQKIIIIDDNFEEMTGYSKDDLEKYNLTQNDLIPFEDRDEYFNKVFVMIQKYQEAYLEHRLVRKDGSIRYVFCYGVQFFDSVTREPRSSVIITDISTTSAMQHYVNLERESIQRSMDKMEENSRKDSLTGLLNHEAYKNDVGLELMTAKQDIVYIMADLDYFKQYNDTYGHQQGDELLQLVARTLSNAVGENGFAGRIGGDEFSATVRVPNGADKETIDGVVKNVFETVFNKITSLEGGVSMSMGAAVSSSEVNTFSELYKLADAALYKAKEAGRGCYRLSE